MRKIPHMVLIIALCLAAATAAALGEGAIVPAADEGEAVRAIRAELVARNGDFTIAVTGTGLTDEAIAALMTAALEHTGVPNEGDYLLHHMNDSSAGGPVLCVKAGSRVEQFAAEHGLAFEPLS